MRTLMKMKMRMKNARAIGIGLAIGMISLAGMTQKATAQNHAKDIRQTYLWDVTLSMKGYNNAPKIYDKVVDVLVKDINRIDNERTEIVVIPFQDNAHCEVWREPATPEGKRNIIEKIKAYDNGKVTNTNISAPLQYVISDVFSTDKIDILKLMTDGEDNVNPQRLHDVLDHWCEIAKEKDAYGYYILLTDAAKKGEISLQLQGICNFEEVDVTDGNYTGIAEIVQETPAFTEGIPINIRDEYNRPKRLEFVQYMGKEVPVGFEIHFKTEPNPYIEVDEVATIRQDNSVEIHPHFLQTQDSLIHFLPTDHPLSVATLHYEPTAAMQSGKFAFTRLTSNQCPILLINKPEKTVRIYVK